MDKEKVENLNTKICLNFLIKGLKRIVYSYLKIKLTEIIFSLFT